MGMSGIPRTDNIPETTDSFKTLNLSYKNKTKYVKFAAATLVAIQNSCKFTIIGNKLLWINNCVACPKYLRGHVKAES